MKNGGILINITLINVDKAMTDAKLKSKMLLQVFDVELNEQEALKELDYSQVSPLTNGYF